MTRYLAVIAVLAASPCLAQETRTIVKGATDQSVYIRIVDAADGTPETGVTSATAGLDLEYVRNRAAAADLTESDLAAVDSAHSDGGIKHVGNGIYRVDLPDAACATGVDGVLVTGTATDMVVIPARIQLTGFDLQDATPAADVTTWNGTAVASPNTAGYPVVTVKDGTGTGEINTASGVVDANATQVLGTALNDGIAFGGTFEDTIAENISMFFGSTANFGSDSAAATTISDVKVSAAAILDDTGTTGVVVAAGTEIEVADADLRSALGMAAADLDTQLDAIVADTNELQTDWVNGGRLDLILDDILLDTGTTLQAEVDGIQADTEDIQSRLPAALVSGRIDASVGAMASGVVTASAVATGAVDADALATDAVSEIADGAWDEAISGHLTAGSTGAALNAAGSAGDPWTTTLPGSYTGSQAGKILSDILADTGTDGVVIASGQTMEMSATELRSALGMSAADLDAQLDAIVADTNELQTDWVNGGRLDLLIDSIKAATDLLNSAQAEPTGVPAANETPLDKLAYVYMMLRNKITVTADTKTYFDDGGAAEFKKGLTDDGTTYTEAEAAAP